MAFLSHVSEDFTRSRSILARSCQSETRGSLVRYRPEDLQMWLAALPTGGSAAAEKQIELRAVK